MESVKSQKGRVEELLEAKFKRPKSSDDELQRHLEARLRSGTFVEHPKFCHRALTSPKHTRLLIIFPGTWDQEVQCSLQDLDTTKPGQRYVALSYVWGNKTHQLPIVCDGALTLIGVNLYSAIVRLRTPDKAVPVWVDALCINQHGDPAALRERALQVRMMDRIYRSADHVLVDLGGCNIAETAKLMTCLELLDRNSFAEYDQAQGDKSMLDHIVKLAEDNDFWKALLDFARRPWFQRVWVVQEFVLGKQVTMTIGRFCISLERLSTAFTKIHSSIVILISRKKNHLGTRVLPRISTMTQSLARFQIARAQAQGELSSKKTGGSNTSRSADGSEFGKRLETTLVSDLRQTNFLDPASLLDFSRYLKATDPRDHVYALMGIIQNLDLSDFAIDYNEGEATLATRFARTLIKQGFGMYCLFRARGTNEYSPSWVPPLHVDFRFQSMGLHTAPVEQPLLETVATYARLYNACGRTKLDVRLVNDPKLLSVQAIRVDSIKSFSLPAVAHVLDANAQQKKGIGETVIRDFQQFYAWATSNFKDWDDRQKFQDSFWRTIIADCTWYTFGQNPCARASPDISKHFEDLCQLVEGRDSLTATYTVYRSPQVSQEQSQSARRFLKMFYGSSGKKVCRTGGGRMALIPGKSTHDNEIWIVLGMAVPLVLRKIGDHHVIVGQCYLHGMMDGQAMEKGADIGGSKLDVETIHLR